MYVLVYFGVLHDDKSVQLAYENRIIPLPDLRWQSDAYANANANSDSDANSDADSNTYSDTHTNANSDTDADTCACAECAEQSVWKCCIRDADQSVVDG